MCFSLPKVLCRASLAVRPGSLAFSLMRRCPGFLNCVLADHVLLIPINVAGHFFRGETAILQLPQLRQMIKSSFPPDSHLVPCAPGPLSASDVPLICFHADGLASKLLLIQAWACGVLKQALGRKIIPGKRAYIGKREADTSDRACASRRRPDEPAPPPLRWVTVRIPFLACLSFSFARIKSYRFPLVTCKSA